MNFNLNIDDSGHGSVSFVNNGVAVTIQHDHPNFARITHALIEGNDPSDFLDIFKAATSLSNRVTVTDDAVFFDGEEIRSGVSRTILRYQAEGRDSANLVRFLERVQQNPSRHSREQLWNWISDRDLHIREDGCIVAWKSVQVVQESEVGDPEDWGHRVVTGETYTSHSSGTAWVNGTKHDGQIPYALGDVVTIPRELVEDDPSVACSHGLHIGTFDYASSFGSYRSSKILEVAVAPEDIVSVPNDSNSEKIRCARFEVLGVQEHPQAYLGHHEPEATWDFDTVEEAFASTVPQTFLGRLLGRLRGEIQDDEDV